MRVRTRKRGWSLSVVTLVVAASATTAVALVAAAPVAANNDPHRIYLAAAPFDVPATVCGFAVHVEPLVDREYAKVTTNPDGSTSYKITGAAFLNLTNTTTGKTITLNISGPGTSTYSAGRQHGGVRRYRPRAALGDEPEGLRCALELRRRCGAYRGDASLHNRSVRGLCRRPPATRATC